MRSSSGTRHAADAPLPSADAKSSRSPGSISAWGTYTRIRHFSLPTPLCAEGYVDISACVPYRQDPRRSALLREVYAEHSAWGTYTRPACPLPIPEPPHVLAVALGVLRVALAVATAILLPAARFGPLLLLALPFILGVALTPSPVGQLLALGAARRSAAGHLPRSDSMIGLKPTVANPTTPLVRHGPSLPRRSRG